MPNDSIPFELTAAYQLYIAAAACGRGLGVAYHNFAADDKR